MDVGMMIEVLAPCVQDEQTADLGAKVLGIGRGLLKGLGGGPKQKIVNDFLVLLGQRRELVGKGENDVVVLNGQKLTLPIGEPLGAGRGLAFGAVPIPARVASDLEIATSIAAFDMAARGGGSAGGDIVEDPAFGSTDAAVPGGDKVVSVGPNDVG